MIGGHDAVQLYLCGCSIIQKRPLTVSSITPGGFDREDPPPTLVVLSLRVVPCGSKAMAINNQYLYTGLCAFLCGRWECGSKVMALSTKGFGSIW